MIRRILDLYHRQNIRVEIVAALLLVVGGLLSAWLNGCFTLKAARVTSHPSEKRIEQSSDQAVAVQDSQVGGDLILGNKYENPAPTLPCEISPSIATRIITRHYVRKKLDEMVGKEHAFQFQELFYEWELDVSSQGTSGKLSGQLSGTRPEDRVAAEPSSGHVSEAHGAWFSGFTEPRREKPDYYTRTFQFDYLGVDGSAKLRLRRSLQDPRISETELLKLVGLRSENCVAKSVSYDAKADASRLTTQAQRLASLNHGSSDFPRGLPIMTDPGDVRRDEAQATVEIWCKIDSCEELLVRQLEVHTGQSPAEYYRERSLEAEAAH